MQVSRAFVNEIRELIVSARDTVARGVDLVQVHMNFEIGRRIVEHEQKGRDRAAYGKEVVKTLGSRLTDEFGKGFSQRNLELMRRFFQVYSDRQPQIAQTLSAQSRPSQKAQTVIAQSRSWKKPPQDRRSEPIDQTVSDQFQISQTAPGKSLPPFPTGDRPFTLSWSHYVFLLGIKNADERSFYEIESAQQNWTLRELKRQFDTGLYERLALSRDKAGIRKLAREGQTVARPEDVLKEPYVLEFLGLDERESYSESDLEAAIISRIEKFLLELGKGFLFETRQKRITLDDEHYFIDLVFYNRLLRSYVLLDLKLGKLTHQDLGQMQMYVNYFDRFVTTEGENSTIGIVLCKQKNKALVEITLPKDANIHTREYQLYLPGKDELKRKLVEWTGDSEVGNA